MYISGAFRPTRRRPRHVRRGKPPSRLRARNLEGGSIEASRLRARSLEGGMSARSPGTSAPRTRARAPRPCRRPSVSDAWARPLRVKRPWCAWRSARPARARARRPRLTRAPRFKPRARAGERQRYARARRARRLVPKPLGDAAAGTCFFPQLLVCPTTAPASRAKTCAYARVRLASMPAIRDARRRERRPHAATPAAETFRTFGA